VGTAKVSSTSASSELLDPSLESGEPLALSVAAERLPVKRPRDEAMLFQPWFL
jgi:hypothetical protein